jgi:ABC-type dipeptide/oligopeptide/nickel transport system permease subunit
MSVGGAELLHGGDDPVPPDLTASAAGEIAARSPLNLFWRRLRGDRVAMIAGAFLILLILVAFVFAPLIQHALGIKGPNELNSSRLDSFGQPTGPSGSSPFGVDPLGRDVLARVLAGARVSLTIAILATGISVFLGVVGGMFAGFYRGWVDTFISRTIDVLLAFPILLFGIGLASACSLGGGCLKPHGVGLYLFLPLALLTVLLTGLTQARNQHQGRAFERSSLIVPGVLAGFFLLLGVLLAFVVSNQEGLIKPGKWVVVFVIAFVNWTYIGRIIRGQVLSLREKEFVEASRAQGASNVRILFKEILPNLVAPIIVYSTLIIPQNILFEAALSFLGVGVQPPQASWGAMISDATPTFNTAWWYMLFPGIALLLTVLAFNLLGDGLQDALNPRSTKS